MTDEREKDSQHRSAAPEHLHDIYTAGSDQKMVAEFANLIRKWAGWEMRESGVRFRASTLLGVHEILETFYERNVARLVELQRRHLGDSCHSRWKPHIPDVTVDAPEFIKSTSRVNQVPLHLRRVSFAGEYPDRQPCYALEVALSCPLLCEPCVGSALQVLQTILDGIDQEQEAPQWSELPPLQRRILKLFLQRGEGAVLKQDAILKGIGYVERTKNGREAIKTLTAPNKRILEHLGQRGGYRIARWPVGMPSDGGPDRD